MTVPLYNLTDTWNDGGTVFNGIKLNVTNTASAAGSTLLNLQVGGSSKFGFGIVQAGTQYVLSLTGGFGSSDRGLRGMNNAVEAVACDGSGYCNLYAASVICGPDIYIGSNTPRLLMGAANDVILARDAAGILAQRNGVNAQSFRVYNTYTDASNYERGVFDWTTTANYLTIGTEAAGTGTQRNMLIVGNRVYYRGTGHEFQQATSTRLIIDDNVRFWLTASVTPAVNGEMVVQATSNTSLTFKLKGSDGTVRSASLTLT